MIPLKRRPSLLQHFYGYEGEHSFASDFSTGRKLALVFSFDPVTSEPVTSIRLYSESKELLQTFSDLREALSAFNQD